MCGFAGIVSWDPRYRAARPLLEQMSARLAHRGPDGQGIYLNHNDEAAPDRPQVGLVHRRLAILDPDPRAGQPFTDGRGRWVVFNGEIYNFRELRGELESLRPDYAWRTSGDTEVLLVAYDAWGERCVEHFNGMFAFAVWDEPAGALLLARDRMGQKPLYVAYLTADGSGGVDTLENLRSPPAAVAFASEAGALTGIPWVDTALDSQALAGYLRWGCVPGGLSIYRGIAQVGPGHTRTIGSRAGAQSGRSYFKPTPRAQDGEGPHRWADGAAVARTRELVSAAVQRQLVADVPVGCLLSGGIDSSVVALAMTRAAPPGQRVLTFSIGFADARYDEAPFAAAVAGHLRTEHRAFVVEPRAADDLCQLAAAFGEPFGDSSALPTHYLARVTRAHVKVALGGDGGDELFGGYDRYRAMRLGQRLRRAFTPLPWVALAPLARTMAGGHPKSARARAGRLLASLGLPAGRRYASYVRLFDERQMAALLAEPLGSPDSGGGSPEAFEWAYQMFRCQTDAVRAALAIDRETYLPDDLLTKLDRASMLHALEVRSPFMDHELVRFAADLTTPQLLRGGPKRMLREAFAADLPPFVFKRRKMGFAVPIGDWFRGPLRAMLRDTLFAAGSFASQHFVRRTVERLVAEHESRRADHAQRLYALLMLELWWQGQRRG